MSLADFGAAGNDFTDNTTAINNALASFGDRGGTLLVPAGVFRFNSTIVWPTRTSDGLLKPIMILGLSHGFIGIQAGVTHTFTGASVLKFHGTGPGFDLTNGKRTYLVSGWERDIACCGFQDVGLLNGGGGGTYGVDIWHGFGCKFDHFILHSWTGAGIRIAGEFYYNPVIKDCFFDDNPVGILFDRHSGSTRGAVPNGVIIENCRFVGCSDAGIKAQTNIGGGTPIKIVGGWSENSARFLRTGNLFNIVVSDVYLESLTAEAIDWRPPTSSFVANLHSYLKIRDCHCNITVPLVRCTPPGAGVRARLVLEDNRIGSSTIAMVNSATSFADSVSIYAYRNFTHLTTAGAFLTNRSKSELLRWHAIDCDLCANASAQGFTRDSVGVETP